MEYNDYNGITNYIGLIMLANNSCKIIYILCGVFVSEQCYKSTVAKHWNELLSHWYDNYPMSNAIYTPSIASYDNYPMSNVIYTPSIARDSYHS